MTDEDIIELTAGKGVNPFKEAHEALRERVAKAVWLADFEPYDPADRIPFAEANETSRLYCLAEADAAIAICFEEAEQMTRPPAHMLGSTDSYANGYRAACDEIAAALRAYVSKQIILPLPQKETSE